MQTRGHDKQKKILDREILAKLSGHILNDILECLGIKTNCSPKKRIRLILQALVKKKETLATIWPDYHVVLSCFLKRAKTYMDKAEVLKRFQHFHRKWMGEEGFHTLRLTLRYDFSSKSEHKLDFRIRIQWPSTIMDSEDPTNPPCYKDYAVMASCDKVVINDVEHPFVYNFRLLLSNDNEPVSYETTLNIIRQLPLPPPPDAQWQYFYSFIDIWFDVEKEVRRLFQFTKTKEILIAPRHWERSDNQVQLQQASLTDKLMMYQWTKFKIFQRRMINRLSFPSIYNCFECVVPELHWQDPDATNLQSFFTTSSILLPELQALILSYL